MPRGVEVACMQRTVNCRVGEVVSGRSTEEITRMLE